MQIGGEFMTWEELKRSSTPFGRAPLLPTIQMRELFPGIWIPMTDRDLITDRPIRFFEQFEK